MTQLRAARLATRGGVVGGHSAGRLWLMDGARNEEPELVLPADDTREQPASIRLSWRTLAPQDVAVIGGLPVTTPIRTLRDVAQRDSARIAGAPVQSGGPKQRGVSGPHRVASLQLTPR